MAKILIDTLKVSSLLNIENSIEMKLKSLSQDVDGIRSNLRYKIAGQEAIVARLKEAVEQINKEQLAVSALQSGLEEIIANYNNTEKRCAAILETDSLELRSLADAVDKTTKTFDDDKKNGTYGADQGDMAHNKKGIWFFGFRWFEDEDLFDYIRGHSRYKNYSQTEIAKLMDKINSEGCGYVAMVNNIFVEYEGREKEFERVFGFPMYDKKGRANYNYLLVDFYASTDDRYYIDEPMGATALVNDVILQYIDGREDEFRAKYGCDPLIDGNYINQEAAQRILDEYQTNSVATLESSGTTTYSLENRFKHYMEQKGISCSTKSLRGDPMPSSTEINKYLDEGQNVNIAVGGFNLYKENGKVAAKNVEDHWMTITGVTEDGRYIVSSWGERYYLKPSELKGADFYITDISA